MAHFLERVLFLHPRKSLLVAFAALFFVTPGFIYLDLDFGVRIWFRQNDQMIQDFDRFNNVFGSENYVFLALTKKDGDIFNAETIRLIQKLSNDIYNAPKVQRIDSLANFTDMIEVEDQLEIIPLIGDLEDYSPDKLNILKEEILSHPLLPGQFVSRKGESALFLIRLNEPSERQITYRKTIRAIREIYKPYEEQGDHSFQLIGSATVVEEFRKIAEWDLLRTIPLLCLILGILLYFVFKSLRVLLLVFFIIGASIYTTIGVSGLMGFTLNNLSAMVPGVVIAITLADSIHFLSILFVRGQGQVDNARYSLHKNLLGTFLTTLTTSVGFFSLTVSDLVPISNFGFLCAVGSIAAWFFSLFFIFPLMVLFDFKVQTTTPNFKILSRFFNKLSIFSVKYASPVIIAFITCGGIFLFTAIQNQVNSNPFEYFNNNLRIYKDNQKLNQIYGGFSNFEVMVDSGEIDGIYNPDFLRDVDEIQQWMRANIESSYVVSLVDYIKRLNWALDKESLYEVPNDPELIAQLLMLYSLNLPPGLDQNHMKSIDDRFLRISNFWGVQTSKEFLEYVDKFHRKAEELGLNVLVTGREYLYNGMNDYVIQSYFKSIGLTILGIAFVLVFVLGSFKMGLISLIPNLFSIIVGSGTMYLMGKHIDVGTILVASVCFGIAVDDTIHFLLDVKRKSMKHSGDEQIYENVYNETGSALVLTTIFLVLSFSVFLMADFVPNYNFGLFSAIILTTALVTDLVLLPSIMTKTKIHKR